MTYSEKLKSFIGKEGILYQPDQECPYFWFSIDSGEDQIKEVGDDYVIILQETRGGKRQVFIPLNIIYFYFYKN